MKNVKEILQHLSVLPDTDIFLKYECLKNLQGYLKNFDFYYGIHHMYVHSDTLFFIFSHPNALQLFNSVQRTKYSEKRIKEILSNASDFTQDTIKDAQNSPVRRKLNMLLEIKPECKCIDALFIKGYVLKYKKFTKEPQIDTSLRYKERSHGKFNNFIKNPQLFRLCEDIRTQICANL